MFGFSKKQVKNISSEEVRSLASPTDLDFTIFGATASLSGVNISPATAMAVPAVAAGVKAIAEAAGILPLHIYQRQEDGSRERLPEHPAYKLLNAAANPWTGGGSFRELLTADAVAYGNGYAQIVRDRNDKPVELHRLHPPSVAIEIDSITGEPRYKVTAGGRTRVLAFSEVLHLRAPATLSTDSVCGKSPLMEAKDAVGLLIVLNRYANQLFSNGGRPSGVLSFKRALGAEVAKRMKASWQAATSGGNAAGTAILEEEGSFTPLAFSSVDSQFMEIWNLCISEIARILRVPPVLLMDYSRQTWANAETGGLQFLTYTLAPWLSRWETEISLKLIDDADREKVFAEHLTDALLRSDFATRATAYGQYRSMGAMTANEVRQGLNLPKITGGDVLQNPYTTTGKDDQQQPAKKDEPTDA
jgi:HK97 family phage portal protein